MPKDSTVAVPDGRLVPNHPGSGGCKAFISHREGDLAIAEMITRHLVNLSRGRLGVFLSRQMPAGRQYRRWIKESIDQANLLIFIFTGPHSLTPWCSYELGWFLKKAEEAEQNTTGDLEGILSKRLVCLLSRGFIAPSGPIDDLQAITADAANIENFYVDILLHGKYTGGEPLVQGDANFYSSVRGYAAALANAMSPVRTTQHFRGRMTIAFRSGEQMLDDPAIVGADEQVKRLLELVGCRENVATLGQLKDLLPNSPATAWIEELEDHVARNARLPTLAPFRDSLGRMYIPVPARVEKIDDRPAEVEILFVVSPDALRDCADLELRDPLAREQFEVVKLLRMGRRFRYDIVEPWSRELQLAKADRLDEAGMKKICNMYYTRLQRLEREGRDEKVRSYSFTSTILGLPGEEHLERLYGRYFEIDMKKLVEAVDVPAIERALEVYRELNKAFMFVALESLSRKLEKCRPAGVDRAEVLAAAFGDPTKSSRRRPTRANEPVALPPA